MTGCYRFDRFVLDVDDRRLTCDGAPVELSARYLDALALLVADAGRLVPKTRFMDEVWRGVPVTDEALTQCVRALRRALGDDAQRPRFIETVPKHGYRFVAPVEPCAPAGTRTPRARRWPRVAMLGGAGALGGGGAGTLGGIAYGFAVAAQAPQPGMGALSILLVLACVTALLAAAGGGAVALGIALAGYAENRATPWLVAGGAGGGLLVGALVKLIGLDAFALFLGQAPAAITGAPEGVVLGAAVGLGAWASLRATSGPRAIAQAAACGAAAGVLIVLAGGRLLAGSLDLLEGSFPASRLRLAAAFGDHGLTLPAHAATAAAEGALFAACAVAALRWYRR